MVVAVHNLTKTGYYSDGKVQTNEPMKIAQGLPPLRTWVPAHYFIDLMRRASNGVYDQFPPPTIVTEPDANGWCDCTESGTEAFYAMGSGVSSQGFWFPTGPDMVLRWSNGGDCYLELSTGVPSQVSSSAGRIIYDGSGGSEASVKVWAENGYPQDIQLFQSVAHETLYDGGQQIHPDFIIDVDQVCTTDTPLRFMDLMQTNGTDVLDYLTEWDHLTSTTNGSKPILYPREGSKFMHIRSIAEIANETGRPPWICIPVMMTDQAVTDMLNDLKTYLNSGLDVWIEYGNEHWNFGTAFKNGFNWTRMARAPLHESTVDPITAIATDIGHGLVTGDDVIYFNRFNSDTSYPYDGGQEGYIVRVDDDNFVLCDSIFGDRRRVVTVVTNANPGVVTFTGRTSELANNDTVRIYNESTGMTEINDIDFQVQNYDDVAQTFELYTIGGTPLDTTLYGAFSGDAYFLRHDVGRDTGMTSISWKNPDERPGGGLGTNEEYALQAVRVWALADAVFGRARTIHVGGTKFWSNSPMGGQLINDFLSEVDYVAIAPYVTYVKMKGGGPDNIGWETQTDAELADFIIDNLSYLLQQVQDHIDALGAARIICYEGGLEVYGQNDEMGAQLGGFVISSDCARLYDAYLKGLSSKGVKMFCNFQMTYPNAGTELGEGEEAWGLQNYTSERDIPRWVTVKGLVDDGGAPPN